MESYNSTIQIGNITIAIAKGQDENEQIISIENDGVVYKNSFCDDDIRKMFVAFQNAVSLIMKYKNVNNASSSISKARCWTKKDDKRITNPGEVILANTKIKKGVFQINDFIGQYIQISLANKIIEMSISEFLELSVWVNNYIDCCFAYTFNTNSMHEGNNKASIVNSSLFLGKKFSYIKITIIKTQYYLKRIVSGILIKFDKIKYREDV